jgi:hypothetical protein
MIARTVRTTCVVAALCVVGFGAHGAPRVGAHRVGPRGAQIARVRAGGPPIIQVGPSCEAAGAGSVILGRNKESCLADETTAQDTLKQNWPKYLAADKSDCVTLENSGGPASYVELVSCLEVMRDARSIKNADPLESELGRAPVSTRRGKRK